jgi:hypothetical protein
MLKRVLALVAVALMTTACASARPKTFSGEFTRPPAASRILVMTPNVELAILTAAGLPEPREDWSVAARTEIAAGIAEYMASKGHSASALDPNTAMDGRSGQIIRLHDAVGASILAVNYLQYPLPTRRNNFEWTLGEGVQELAQQHNADYALFITVRGSYSSSARMAAVVGLAILGVGLPTGGQQAFASLVDLRTGNIIWFNVAQAATGQDMREPAGARDFVQVLMRGAPL